MTDIKKDTLKNQLDDALRQSTNATMFINPEMAVIQLNTIMDEQCVKFANFIGEKGYRASCVPGQWVKEEYYTITERINTSELLTKHKQENGL